MSKEASLTDGVNCLRAKAADGIFTALERQLSVVSFFTDKESDSDLIAPLTNLGCESNFSGFGNDCKGPTKIYKVPWPGFGDFGPVKKVFAPLFPI